MFNLTLNVLCSSTNPLTDDSQRKVFDAICLLQRTHQKLSLPLLVLLRSQGVEGFAKVIGSKEEAEYV